jgi:hypothetical protein
MPSNYDPYSFLLDEADIYSTTKPQNTSFSFTSRFSKNVNRWYKAEYFYSWIDKPYYQINDFKNLLEAMDLGGARLNTKEWSIVR